jgi:hypothetical protein
VGLTLVELPFVDRPIGKFEDAIALLLIVLPLPFIDVPIAKFVDPTPMLHLSLEGTLIGIPIFEGDLLFLLVVVLRLLDHFLSVIFYNCTEFKIVGVRSGACGGGDEMWCGC